MTYDCDTDTMYIKTRFKTKDTKSPLKHRLFKLNLTTAEATFAKDADTTLDLGDSSSARIGPLASNRAGDLFGYAGRVDGELGALAMVSKEGTAVLVSDVVSPRPLRQVGLAFDPVDALHALFWNDHDDEFYHTLINVTSGEFSEAVLVGGLSGAQPIDGDIDVENGNVFWQVSEQFKSGGLKLLARTDLDTMMVTIDPYTMEDSDGMAIDDEYIFTAAFDTCAPPTDAPSSIPSSVPSSVPSLVPTMMPTPEEACAPLFLGLQYCK